MKRFDLDQFLKYMVRYKITETVIVNPIIFKILAMATPPRENLSTLKCAWAGGAPLDGLIQNQFMNLLQKDSVLIQVWGMTEIGWITTFPFPEKDLSGSVGRLLPNVEAR
jgi:4-coumarate--CoA ligase